MSSNEGLTHLLLKIKLRYILLWVILLMTRQTILIKLLIIVLLLFSKTYKPTNKMLWFLEVSIKKKFIEGNILLEVLWEAVNDIFNLIIFSPFQPQETVSFFFFFFFGFLCGRGRGVVGVFQITNTWACLDPLQ